MTQKDQSIHRASREHLGILILDIGIMARVAQGDRVAGVARGFLGAADDATEKALEVSGTVSRMLTARDVRRWRAATLGA